MTSGQFNAELFALANGANFAEDDEYTTFATEHPEYDATAHTLTLKETPVEGTVSIAGVDAEDISVEGKVVTVNLANVEDEEQVEVSYEYVVEDANVIQVDNKTSAIGEAVFKWPIYGSGDDCTDASIKGYVIMHLYRCRVTQMPKQTWAA